MRFRIWAFAHDVFGALSILCERARKRAVRGMSAAVKWEEP